MTLLFFAYLRERSGVDEMQIDLPSDVNTVEELVTHLSGLNDSLAATFAERVFVRMAVNQKHADWQTPVHNDDEVAFFPPITGG